MTDRQLTAKEAADLAGIQRETFRSYVARGHGPAEDGRIGVTAWWFESTIHDWLANRPGAGARTDLKDS